MVWLKILLQIVSVAIAYVVARQDYVTHDKRTRGFKTGLIWLWLLLILLVVGNIFVIWNDDQESNEIRTQLGDLRNELGDTKKAVTGGDNFPYVMIDMGKDLGGLSVHNPGDSPLYDVSFRMWDPHGYASAAKSSNGLETVIAKSIHMEVGNLTPRGARVLGKITLPNSDSIDFKVTMRARNGGFTEWMSLRKVNGIWKRAVRVHPGDVNPDESVLYEFSDPGFPDAQVGKNRK